MRTVVLGAGIIGLTTALRLHRAGHEVEVVSAHRPAATTSWVAAGIWFPTHVGPPDRVARWGRRTFEAFSAAAQDAAIGRPGAVPGVVMRESLMLFRGPRGAQPWIEQVGEVRDATAQELPPGYHDGLRFAVPLADMPVYLPWLLAQVQQRCAFTLRRVAGLDELAGPGVGAIVNCTGLAAREVAADPGVYPVRGQIVRVANPGLTMSVRDEHHPAGRAYVHPRSSDVILGGTLEVGIWDTAVDEDVAASILARCLELVPDLAGATVLEHVAGLRPGRATVRLEEAARHPSGTRILHNYGHGGAGVTLCWGCADEIAALLDGEPA